MASNNNHHHPATAARRLTQIRDFLTMNKTAMEPPWNPDSTIFPTRHDLPDLPNAPKGAAWVWGEQDQLGRLNLLTPTRVMAAKTEIRTGEIVPVNLPLDVPATPSFERQPFKHTIKPLVENFAYDDVYELNTQSGTQWDGFRHFVHPPSGMFYNRARGSDFLGENANLKCSIHYWAEHGIAGRGVLLDFRGYAEKKGIRYDAYEYYKITYDQLYACGKDQGIDIRPTAQGGDIKPGDMLFVRMGWKQAYDSMAPEKRHEMATRPHQRGPDSKLRYAGIAQEEQILDWLHDCYFAAVAGDAPSFEAWPLKEPFSLHEHILALWGMPLGEMLDLERLTEKCREQNRWFFFFTSAPANTKGGVGSHVNGMAIF